MGGRGRAKPTWGLQRPPALEAFGGWRAGGRALARARRSRARARAHAWAAGARALTRERAIGRARGVDGHAPPTGERLGSWAMQGSRLEIEGVEQPVPSGSPEDHVERSAPRTARAPPWRAARVRGGGAEGRRARSRRRPGMQGCRRPVRAGGPARRPVRTCGSRRTDPSTPPPSRQRYQASILGAVAPQRSHEARTRTGRLRQSKFQMRQRRQQPPGISYLRLRERCLATSLLRRQARQHRGGEVVGIAHEEFREITKSATSKGTDSSCFSMFHTCPSAWVNLAALTRA